ncbi:hypothetical protein DFA_11782 [Cavenderia fasciculata]|uniref:IPT/TIG domain-containing protein n=1 Tax=Cavenderia fasciculata TaxID=261658 RepID=F4QE73_CACFS|nr:uncharacterized protein DFA_11782 [Cavenderia fasciculata]EGG14020.1 hypothetical protein DFA_11782 [Cavenderia fasciculata]|eukprot:XP_004350728.1 hypothetical protein DFA_11782 [Cavenderia fasciculata]
MADFRKSLFPEGTNQQQYTNNNNNNNHYFVNSKLQHSDINVNINIGTGNNKKNNTNTNHNTTKNNNITTTPPPSTIENNNIDNNNIDSNDWNPIRITIYSDNLLDENDTKYSCKNRNQNVFMLENGTMVSTLCRPNDVLTPEKRQHLNKMIREAVEFFQSTLSMTHPIDYPIKFGSPLSYCNPSAPIAVPPEFILSGVNHSDLVLLVTSRPLVQNDVLAFVANETDWPIFYSIYPETGAPGSLVTIQGRNFYGSLKVIIVEPTETVEMIGTEMLIVKIASNDVLMSSRLFQPSSSKYLLQGDPSQLPVNVVILNNSTGRNGMGLRAFTLHNYNPMCPKEWIRRNRVVLFVLGAVAVLALVFGSLMCYQRYKAKKRRSNNNNPEDPEDPYDKSHLEKQKEEEIENGFKFLQKHKPPQLSQLNQQQQLHQQQYPPVEQSNNYNIPNINPLNNSPPNNNNNNHPRSLVDNSGADV